jgi:hypothetical protein
LSIVAFFIVFIESCFGRFFIIIVVVRDVFKVVVVVVVVFGWKMGYWK